MKVVFTPKGWDDFCSWIESEPKKLNRIVRLIKQARRQPFTGLGEPEPLRHELAGWWSRRIDKEHRLVYRVLTRDREQVLEIAQCRHHY